MAEAAPKTPPRRWLRLLAIAGVVALVGLLLLYAARRVIAREALTAWLRSKGVTASAQVHAFGPTGLAGAMVIGDPQRPDFSAERAEVGYGFGRSGLQVRSVRLVRPVLRAGLHDGKFSAGSLDPLIRELTQGPPRPGAPKPKVVIEGGRLLLATDWGPLDIRADGTIADGRLEKLAARAAPTRLKGPRFDVGLGAANATAEAVDGRLELSIDAPVTTAAAGALAAENARLRLTAAGPYPDLAHRRADGAVVAHAELSGGRIAYQGEALRNGLVSAALTGQATGPPEALTLAGRAVADLRAGGAEVAGASAGPLRAAASLEQLRWTRKGGDAVQGQLAVNASLDKVTGSGFGATGLAAAARGPVAFARGRADFTLVAHALGRGGWTGLGAPTRADSAEIAATKRAAQGFGFAAPAVTVRSDAGRLSARFDQPVRLAPDRGGFVTLAQAGAGYRLTATGGGLPRIDARIDRFALTDGGAVATGRIRAGLSLGPIEGGDFDASGALRIAGDAVSFTGDRCAVISARKLELGANDVEHFANRLCPAGRPLITLAHGDWRIAGRAEEASGDVPFLQAKLAHGAGPVELGAVRGVLDAHARIDHAEATDAAPQTRFNPVAVTGEAQTARGLWTSTLHIADRAGRRLAEVRIHHADAGGRGGLDVDSGAVRFAEGGLQPAALSPLAAPIGSPAEGQVRFTGRMDWTPSATTSSGVLDVPGVDFQSPLGKVAGLSGRIAFSSLAPLLAAPGQALKAASVVTPIAPLRDVKLTFGLAADALTVTGGEASVGGGLARIETLEVPLTPGRPMRGVIDLDGVQLHDLVEASPFGDKVDLDAKVSGRIPFTLQDEKVRVAGGSLQAVQPGRLSIQRTALTGVEASGTVSAPGAPAQATPEPSTDTFSDFAYQAMENLAFSTLTASVDSRPDGRLGVIFHIIGKHDPPQHQEIRIGLRDLIQKKFLGRKLPLPSGTGVDLTLDTTLNLDDLLSDYAQFRSLHGSAEVQPAAPGSTRK